MADKKRGSLTLPQQTKLLGEVSKLKEKLQIIKSKFSTAEKNRLLKRISSLENQIRKLKDKYSLDLKTKSLVIKDVKKEAEQLKLSIGNLKKKTSISEQIKLERSLAKTKSLLAEFKKRQKKAINLLNQKDRQIEAMKIIGASRDSYRIPISKKTSSGGEATAVIVASDWHVDETVRAASVNELNRFNPKIAEERANNFFVNSVKLLNMSVRDVSVDTIILALLGDFLSGSIHEELKFNNSMLPIEAVIFAQKLITSGIKFLLENTNCNLIIPCCAGNHGRMTQKVHHASEYGQSLEYLMYIDLADRFVDEKRIQFVISKGYHTYIKVYNKLLRFHHGHDMRYLGGVGGISIPVNKSIAQWNKLKTAYLDIFGHFHQRCDLGNWLCNGSLIGYNAYALSIKASFEAPQQTFFLIDKKRGKTVVAPILLGRKGS